MSIGIIDTVGFAGSVKALDTCLKTADVEFVRYEIMSGGIVSLVIKGDVAAVSASIAAGAEAAKSSAVYRNHTIIARLDDQTKDLLSQEKRLHEKAKTLEDPAIEEASIPEVISTRTDLMYNKRCAYSEEDLTAMTVSRLRKLAREMNLKNISREKIKRSRKVDLIANILKEQEE